MDFSKTYLSQMCNVKYSDLIVMKNNNIIIPLPFG